MQTVQDLFLSALLVGDSTLRISTTLIFAALAGLFSERSGIVNIALEGKMLGAAFVSATVAYLLDSSWLGMLSGIGIAVLLSLLHGYACIRHKGEQIISGLAINLLAAGLTVVVAQAIFHKGGNTPTLSDPQRFLPIKLIGSDAVANIPFLGPLYSEFISGHTIFVYIAVAMVPVTWWIIYKSKFGLYLRAAGENPEALDAAGVSVVGIRFLSLVACGILVGLAGSYLAQGQNAFFIRNMSAGQGYIALAALIFGKWRPSLVLVGCLLFGILDASSLRLQGVRVDGFGLWENSWEIPVILIQTLPYVLTVMLLAGFFGKAEGPKAIGKPFVTQRDS